MSSDSPNSEGHDNEVEPAAGVPKISLKVSNESGNLEQLEVPVTGMSQLKPKSPEEPAPVTGVSALSHKVSATEESKEQQALSEEEPTAVMDVLSTSPKSPVEPDNTSPQTPVDGAIPSDSVSGTIRLSQMAIGETTVCIEHAPQEVIGNRYKVIREIGRGGMGIVYLAQDQKLNRYVAIKRLLQSANRSTVQRRFLREAQTIASLGHIHIVNIHDIGQDEFGYYITMEYISGPESLLDPEEKVPPIRPISLSEYVKIKGPLPYDEALTFILKLCSALDYAHNRDIIHRDIKPSNILLDERFEPKVVDFGLARPIGIKDTEEITLQGQPMGTPEYVAPEQWSDAKDTDCRADIFAVGGVFWYMISGKIPRYFRESELPEDIRAPIAKTLAHKRNDRYSTIKELSSALEKTDLDSVAEQDSGVFREILAAGKWACPNCRAANADAAKYCFKCGSFGMETCPKCEEEVRVGTQFCANCGVDMKLAEESSSVLVTARNQAEFREYEAALSTIKILDSKNHPDAGGLSKKWRQIILNRRNLLSDLDSAIRIFNVEKAVKVFDEVRELIPMECISESPDFDTVVKYSSLDIELKNLLKESAARAQDDYNLDKFSQNISFLNQVCGLESCNSINTELQGINTELNNIVTKAGLAVGMNCLSRAMDMLESSSPWKGSELGDRRNRMMKNCEVMIEERESLIDNLEEAAQKNNYCEGIKLLSETSRFRLPPNNSEMEPDDDDLAAHERIVEVDKALSNKFLQKMPDWIEVDNWGILDDALNVLRGSKESGWLKINNDLKAQVNKKIAKYYNDAVLLESKGKFLQAEKIWGTFAVIPFNLVPTNLLTYSKEFSKRKQIHFHRTRDTLFKRIAFVLLILWGFAVYKAAILFFRQPPAVRQSKEILDLFIPGITHFVLFSLAFGLIFIKKFGKFERKKGLDIIPARYNLLNFLICISPISLIGYSVAVTFDKFNRVSIIGAILSLLSVAVVWAVIDLVKRIIFRYPVNIIMMFGLTVSWILTSFLPAVVRIPMHKLWPVLTFVHGILFLIIAAIAKQPLKKEVSEPVSNPSEKSP